jgi:hypothetical protein
MWLLSSLIYVLGWLILALSATFCLATGFYTVAEW